jgi:phage shock protein PspC (stress-responsive transcriptional regulator)
VCVGLARHRNLPPRSVRAAFAVAALIGGVGVLAYLACWLIIPAEGDDANGTAGTRGIVVLAQACAACVGLATLAAVGGAATIFGFGWVVLAVAGAVLIAALASWPRVGAGWALLPVAALILPALSMTVGGVRIAPESRDIAIAPQSVADLPRGGYTSGLGTLLVDLRGTSFPARGDVSLRIDAGIRRTIVALPANRCVYVQVDYDVVPFAARVASVLTGRVTPSSEVTLFGRIPDSRTGDTGNAPSPRPADPILQIHFHSAGGSLYVRDYADDVDPQAEPDWPGYPVALEPRPDTTGVPRAAARAMIDSWLLRRRVQSASAATVDRLMPGPCGARSAELVEGQPAQAIPAPEYGVPTNEAAGEPPGGAVAYDANGVPVPPPVPSAPTAPAAGSQATGTAGTVSGGPNGKRASGPAGKVSVGPNGKQASGKAGTVSGRASGKQASGKAGKVSAGPSGKQASGKAGTVSVGPSGKQASGKAGGSARTTDGRSARKSATRSAASKAAASASAGSRR